MRHNQFWYCNVCNAQNHENDGECQYCECGGAECKRDNCSGPTCRMLPMTHDTPRTRAYRHRVGRSYFARGAS